MYRIFIVEDDVKLAEIIGKNLEKYHFAYRICNEKNFDCKKLKKVLWHKNKSHCRIKRYRHGC